MLFHWEECWARWKKVLVDVKLRLWNAFKRDFDLSQIDEGEAQRMWMKQAQKWYRSAMSSIKTEALKTYKVQDVKDLVDKPKLSWMLNEVTLQIFLKRWTNPHTIKVSNSNNRSRATEGAGIHKLGRKGLKTKMRNRFC